jgi:K+ transporter
MDITDALVHTFMRFLHISSVVGLVGAAFYGRMVLTPVLNSLPETERLRLASDAQRRFRTVIYVLLVLMVGAGLYNLLTGPTHSSTWHMWFGIKMLAVLHILATSVLWAVSPYGDAVVEGKGKRRLASLAVSGTVAILISNYLRYLTQHGG